MVNRVLRRGAAWAVAAGLALILACSLPTLAHTGGWWLLAALPMAAALWGLWKLTQRLPEKWCPRLAAVALPLWAALLFLLGWQLRVNPSWDFGRIYTCALDLCQTGNLANTQFYLLEYPFNLPLTVALAAWFKALSLVGVPPLAAGILLNALALAAAVLFLYLALATVSTARRALFALLCCTGFAPLLLYAPVFYTDTLAMPFVTLAFWAAARCARGTGGRPCREVAEPPVPAADQSRPAGKEAEPPVPGPNQKPPAGLRARLLWAALAGAAIGLGTLVKGTTAIAGVALGLAALLLYIRKGGPPLKVVLPPLAVFAGAAALVLGGYNLWSANTRIIDWTDRDAYYMPPAHHIMMGLRDQGGYSGKDYLFAHSFATLAEREAAEKAEIAARLEAYGPLGLLGHLGNKLAYTWADGTYYAPQKLKLEPLAPGALHQWLTPEGRYYPAFAGLAAAAQLLLLALLLGGALRAALQKGGVAVGLAFAARLAVLGLALFLLVWETRSRYLVSFAPLLVLLATDAAARLAAWAEARARGGARR